MFNSIVNFLKGIFSIGRMRADLDSLDENVKQRIRENSAKVNYLEGKLDGVFEAIKHLGLKLEK